VNPFDPGVRQDPYPHYRRLQAEDPVHWSPIGAWVVVRHADVCACLADARLAHWSGPAAGGEDAPFMAVVARWFQLMDPRRGSALHELVRGVLGRARLRDLMPRMARSADDLLQAAGSSEIDIVEALAEPLTLGVAAELLGVPPADRPRFSALARDVMATLFGWSGGLPAGREAGLAELAGATTELARLRGAAPGPDLMSALVEARRRGDAISDDDIVGFATILLYAAYENTMSLVGNAALALADHPDQWDLLRARPELVARAVEELLRFESPVQFVGLRAREDLELGGHVVGAGQAVLVGIGAANRDPARFDHPDRLDVTRDAGPHLAFGSRPLFCVGAGVARVQAQAALGSMLRRFTRIERTAEPLRWRPAPPVLRGLASLPLRVRVA
jgi:cytochrome P450